MDSSNDQDSSASAPDANDAELARLESAIRQLKVQYDMFFGGGLPREPLELRAEVDKLIRRHAHNPMRKYAQRFHFNSLHSRYNSFTELWNKTTRSHEEGDRKHVPPAEPGVKERLLTRCVLADTTSDPTGLRRLHSRYVFARRRAGVAESGLPSLDAFVRGVDSQIQKLRRQARCDQIELRLVIKDDKVQLKARPGR